MRTLLAILACLALQACSIPRALPAASDLRVGPSEVVVVGKIELVPPLDPLEQRTYWNVLGDKRFLSHVFVATGSSYKPVTTSRLDGAEFQSSLEVEWGVPFMVKAPRQRTFLNGAVLHLDIREQDRLWFPGGFYFDVPKDAAAVYIGTLRYFRNDFNSITRVEIVDERKDIASVLKTAGSPAEVRPSLLKRMR
jgi:hypothetical protein